MPKLSMLAITKRVDISILHEDNCEANISNCDWNCQIFLLQNTCFLQMFFKLNASQTNGTALNELTWMVETAADLHGPQFAVEPHRPRGVGGDFAGVLLSTLTATVYKAKWSKSARVSRDTGFLVATIYRGCLCQSPGKTSQRERES